MRLDHWLAEHGGRLTVEQRLTLVRDLAEIMQYAHSRHLMHRNLSPPTILVCDPSRAHPRLMVTDWQAGGRMATTTAQSSLLAGTEHIEQFADPTARLYLASEALTSPDAPGQLLDVFALGR